MKTSHTIHQIQTLNRLIASCYRGLGAYQGAFGRVGEANVRDGMRALMDRHRRTIDELHEVVSRLGGAAPTGSTFRSVDHGKQALRGASTTRAVLVALRVLDEAVWDALAAARDDIDGASCLVIERALEHHARHRRWFEQHLALGPAAIRNR